MSTRQHSDLNKRNVSFLFRYTFKDDHVEVKEVGDSFAAYFNAEAAPRYVAESYSDLWDMAVTDRIQAKLNEHKTA